MITLFSGKAPVEEIYEDTLSLPCSAVRIQHHTDGVYFRAASA